MQHLLIKNGIKKWKNYGVENMEKKWKKNLNFFYWGLFCLFKKHYLFLVQESSLQKNVFRILKLKH